MKTIILGIGLAGVVFVTGCGKPSVSDSTPQKTAARAAEQKTDEFDAGSDSELRERYTRWRREGWTVLSLSGPIAKADGTVVRRAQLTRSKP
jgi:hypothetical protein